MNTRKFSDGQVLERIMFKDKKSLDQLVSSYSTILFKVALRIMGDQREAEQILYEVFREIWFNPNEFAKSNETYLSSYLIKLCKLKCVHREEVLVSARILKKTKKYINEKQYLH
jgi:DNA-directed RNA polymerase specialized sigma24 family protein